MSRRRRHSQTRDTSHIAKSTLRSAPRHDILSTISRLVEDRRTYHPDGLYRPARTFEGLRHQLTIPKFQNVNKPRSRSFKPNLYRSLPHQVGFSQPDQVLICARRTMRRQILFAKRKTGRKGQRKPKHNWYSKIHCRR